jgi:hypothetical protein
LLSMLLDPGVIHPGSDLPKHSGSESGSCSPTLIKIA